MHHQVSTYSRRKGDYTLLMAKDTEVNCKGDMIPELEFGFCKSESIGQLKVQKIGRRTFGECSRECYRCIASRF